MVSRNDNGHVGTPQSIIICADNSVTVLLRDRASCPSIAPTKTKAMAELQSPVK